MTLPLITKINYNTDLGVIEVSFVGPAGVFPENETRFFLDPLSKPETWAVKVIRPWFFSIMQILFRTSCRKYEQLLSKKTEVLHQLSKSC